MADYEIGLILIGTVGFGVGCQQLASARVITDIQILLNKGVQILLNNQNFFIILGFNSWSEWSKCPDMCGRSKEINVHRKIENSR